MIDCKTCCNGAIAPIEATEEMTKPVGQRDGQLYTKPGDTLPEATPEGALLEVVNGEWKASADIPNRLTTAEGDIDDVEDDVSDLTTLYDALYASVDQAVTDLRAINGVTTGTLSQLIDQLEDIKAALRTSCNDFEASISASTPFADYSTSLHLSYLQLKNLLNTILKSPTEPITISNGLNSINTIRGQLMTAINAITPGALTANSPFSDFPAAVTGTQSTSVMGYYTANSNDPIWGNNYNDSFLPYVGELTIPTVKFNGTAMPALLNFKDNQYFWGFFKKIKIPASFTVYRYPMITSNANIGWLEDIEYTGEHVNSWSDHFWYWPLLHRLYMPNATLPAGTDVGITLKGAYNYQGVSKPATINMHSVTNKIYIREIGGTEKRPSDAGISLAIDITSCLRLGGYGRTFSQEPVNLAGCTGTLEAPSATEVGALKGSEYPLTIKLPAVTQLREWIKPTNVANQHIYIGANLSQISDTTTGLNQAGGGLTIHIPAGSSTTKDTLDSKGLSYVQDYVI